MPGGQRGRCGCWRWCACLCASVYAEQHHQRRTVPWRTSLQRKRLRRVTGRTAQTCSSSSCSSHSPSWPSGCSNTADSGFSTKPDWRWFMVRYYTTACRRYVINIIKSALLTFVNVISIVHFLVRFLFSTTRTVSFKETSAFSSAWCQDRLLKLKQANSPQSVANILLSDATCHPFCLLRLKPFHAFTFLCTKTWINSCQACST